MVKDFLNSKKLPYEERNIESGDYTIEDLHKLAPSARTMPQVFSGKVHVGGYHDTVAYFNIDLGKMSMYL
jgi:glutaredoxin